MTVSKLVVTVVALAVLAAGSQRLWRGAAEPPPPVPADTPCVAAGTPVDVRIWFGREQFMPDDRFRSFHAAHPHITVRPDSIPLEQSPHGFLRTFQAGQAPDIIQVEYSEIGVLARRGMLLDVQPLLDRWAREAPELFDVMTDTAWEMASFEGTRHGLALHHGVFWNVYRQDVFDELGLALPKTWDEVLDAAVAISEARRARGMHGYTLNASNAQPPVFDRSRFAQMGGQWVDGVMQIDSPAGHYWLHWMQRAVGRGAVSPNTIAFEWQDVITNFRNGLAAMATISRNIYPIDIAPFLEYGAEWRISPEPYSMPGNEAASRYVTNGWPYLVSAQTRHPCEVGLVLQYLADDPQALSVARRYQPVANTRVMASEAYAREAPWAPDMIEAWGRLETLPYHPNQVAMNRVIRDAMQEALRNPDADVAEMAARYQSQLNRLARLGR